jgi:hypothetical protein
MTVTKAIIEDLLPLYAAGEASEDTRRLVEEYLAAHPEAAPEPERPTPPLPPPPGLEMKALQRTSRTLAQKSWLLAVSMLLTAAPLSFSFDRHGPAFVLYRDLPWPAAFLFAAAAVCWVRFFLICRRLQATGLTPSRSRKTRFAWAIGGYAAGLPLGIVLSYWTGRPITVWVSALTMGLGLWAGERLGQLSDPAESFRPTTLFRKP